MKHKFVLDENILYFAVKGIDVQGKTDPTATELVGLIGRNCHRIAIDPELAGRYAKHLKKLERITAPAMEPKTFLNEFFLNALKASLVLYEHVEMPYGIKVPSEDIHIIKLALRSKAVVVTEDKPLKEAVNAQPTLGLRALGSAEAIELARDH